MPERKYIYVYGDWKELEGPKHMGNLAVDFVRGKEIFSFTYDKNWLAKGQGLQLDPELQLFGGDQYPSEEKENFGVFLDSCPDRWGRVLMKRREAILAKDEKRDERKLYESDYLLGVFDGNRMGAIRYKLDPDSEFLNNNKEFASPPWIKLRELEEASLKLEEEGIENTKDYLKWINLLISPGSSLGGARPKASILDGNENLWIAKFPSRNDDYNIGAWEFVAFKIAQEAGIDISQCKAERFNSKHHTFLTKRFDRDGENKRSHFASAMTCLGKMDGSTDVSYLELATFITINGSNITSDLQELWRRIVLSICVSNIDDHLRNHGFILTDKGWRLSPAFDINPVRDGEGLKLNITETDNSQTLETAMSVIAHFRLSESKALKIVQEVKNAVFKWSMHAKALGIPSAEQERMFRAFRVGLKD
ncbi:MAG: type II toxin-antitoxin system HipA family toxin [Epsilonproteobacteria bacterium]|nr:MAG: type II toxin-antitoxin system HipA family toxin [Campylobacterota bacterium]